MQKSVSCLWSGGFDSTYMVIDYLKKGFKVNTLQIQSPQFINSNLEVDVTKSILPYLEKIGDIRHTVINQEYEAYDTFILPQLPILLMNLSIFSSTNDESVSIGYVMNDDAVSFIKEIENIWNSLRSLKELPKLTFPLIKTKKSVIYKGLKTKHSDIFDCCLCCETKGSLNCGECPSCKRHNEILSSL